MRILMQTFLHFLFTGDTIEFSLKTSILSKEILLLFDWKLMQKSESWEEFFSLFYLQIL